MPRISKGVVAPCMVFDAAAVVDDDDDDDDDAAVAAVADDGLVDGVMLLGCSVVVFI